MILVGVGAAFVLMRPKLASKQLQPIVEDKTKGNRLEDVRKVTCEELAKEMVTVWRSILTTNQSHAAEQAALAQHMQKYRNHYHITILSVCGLCHPVSQRRCSNRLTMFLCWCD
jgi:hypothetical protein